MAADFKLRVVRSEDFVEAYLNRMPAVGITTISEIEQHLKRQERLITMFSICWFEKPELRPPLLPRGVGIGFLQIILFLEKHSVKDLVGFLEEHRFDKNTNPRERARQLKATYDEALKKLKR